MTFHQLEIFDAVAEHCSVTAAARKIRISQPSVSKQLRLLERECGLKLYVKSGRGIKITEEGHLFHIAAKPILRQMEDLKSAFLSRLSDARAATITVGSTPSPAAFFLPEVLKSFVELHPGVHPMLRTGYPAAIEEMVLNGEVDVAVTTIRPRHPRIVVEPIHCEDIVAVVAAKHRLARSGRVESGEVRNVPFVMMKAGRIAAEIKRMGLDLNVVMWCESIELKKAAVHAGLGVGLFYRGSAEAGLREGYFKVVEMPCLQDIKVPCFVIYRRVEKLSANQEKFLFLLRQWSGASTSTHLASRRLPDKALQL